MVIKETRLARFWHVTTAVFAVPIREFVQAVKALSLSSSALVHNESNLSSRNTFPKRGSCDSIAMSQQSGAPRKEYWETSRAGMPTFSLARKWWPKD